MRFAPLFRPLLPAFGFAALLACAPGTYGSITIAGGNPAPDPGPPVVQDGPGHGPPPHAPANGYRRKHEQAYRSHTGSAELVFDSGLGVYVVVGMNDYYFWNGSYLRISNGQWWVSTYLDGDWRPHDARSLPDGLQARYAKAKGHKDKDRYPAKRREDRDDDR
jgi:hypothetical protein